MNKRNDSKDLYARRNRARGALNIRRPVLLRRLWKKEGEGRY